MPQSRTRWHTSVIATLRRPKQENPDFRVSLCYTERLCLKKTNNDDDKLTKINNTPEKGQSRVTNLSQHVLR